MRAEICIDAGEFRQVSISASAFGHAMRPLRFCNSDTRRRPGTPARTRAHGALVPA